MNLLQRFQGLVGAPPLQVGSVISHNAGGTSTVQLPGGGLLTARGQTVPVGQQAYVRDGVVEGPAPVLAITQIEV